MLQYKYMEKRKVFISYHHADQYHKDLFERKYGHLFINKSVKEGDIDTDVSDDYVKKLIQSVDYLADTSVVIVLIGAETWKRKHVDWEISGALDQKINGISGLFGLLLPTYDGYVNNNYKRETIPERLSANIDSGYAKLYKWRENSDLLSYVNEAFDARKSKTSLIKNRSITQMQRNLN